MAGTQVVDCPLNFEACFNLTGVEGSVQPGSVEAAIDNPSLYALLEEGTDTDGNPQDIICVGGDIVGAEGLLTASGDVDLSDGVKRVSDTVTIRMVAAQATAVVLGQVTFRPRSKPLPA